MAILTPSLALGYYGSPDLEQAAFLDVSEPTPELPHKGRWYLTGDLASIDHTGLLTLIDRVNAVVSTKDGVVVKTGAIEAALENIGNVRHALVHGSAEFSSVVVILSVKVPITGAASLPAGTLASFGARAAGSNELEWLRTEQSWVQVSILHLICQTTGTRSRDVVTGDN